MSDLDEVRLVVDGREFMGWKSVRVTTGIDRVARDFDLSVTEDWPGSNAAGMRVQPGQSCELWFGGDKMLTGWIDAAPIAYDATSIKVSVKGRSKTADLVDCSAPDKPGQYMGLSVLSLASELARPFGVSVRSESGLQDPISDVQVEQGETAFNVLDKVLRLRALLATDDGDGNLVLTRAGGVRNATALVLGENILTGQAERDAAKRFRTYIVKGQRSGSDEDFGVSASEGEGSATDSAIRAQRRKVTVASGQADGRMCADQAAWECASAFGNSWKATYTVQGWRQGDGALWAPNSNVFVDDDLIGFKTELLIGEVEYSLSESGTICTLTVAPPGAWTPSPQAPKAKSNGKFADLKPGDPADGFD
jgi:prophage tail gpP-like protein